MLGKLAVAVPLTKNGLALLSIFESASAIDGAIQGKMCGRGVVRAGKGIVLVILNENKDEIIRICDSVVLVIYLDHKFQ